MNLPASARCRIDLILIGTRGKVGMAVLRRLEAIQQRIREESALDLTLIATLDRRGFAFDLQGLVPTSADRALRPRVEGDLERTIAHVIRPGAARTLVIDCTASDEIADCYERLLSGGVGVVGPNKRANSRCLGSYRGLQAAARANDSPYRYETTVGAAIPLLGSLRDLRCRDEQVLSIQGVLSGSLSYILHRVQEGCAFSEAVTEAGVLGYTEPDPREDLRATDLARKVLVLARECGFNLEPGDVIVEPLLDETSTHAASLAELLAAQDATWRERVVTARARGECLVVLAEVDARGARVCLRSVGLDSPFARIKPGQNLVLVRTQLQDATPLVLSGPGAGPEITAAGVLTDLLSAAGQLARRRSSAVGK